MQELKNVTFFLKKKNTFLGNRFWMKWRKVGKTVSDFAYYGFTTLTNFLTLGEEYTGILQVDGSAHVHLPPVWVCSFPSDCYSICVNVNM